MGVWESMTAWYAKLSVLIIFKALAKFLGFKTLKSAVELERIYSSKACTDLLKGYIKPIDI